MNLLPLFLSEALRGIAISWLSIFSSVFIYKRLLEFVNPRLALSFVFLFWSLYGVCKILGTSLAENSSLKQGLKFQLNLGMLLMGAAFLFLNLSSKQPAFLIAGALFWGVSAGSFWFGWHGLMAKLAVSGHYGRAFGFSSFLRGFSDFLAPILGGVLISFGGYPLLFGSALGVTILTLFITLPLKTEKTHHDATIKEIKTLFLIHKRMFLSYFSLGALGVVTSTCFVLYLSLILKKELALGGFFSLSVILVASLKFLIGKFIDLQKRKDFVAAGSFICSLIWVGRLLTKNIPLLFGLNVLNNLGTGMVGMPLEVLTLEKAIDGHSTGRAVLFREIAISVGQTGAAVILFFLSLLSFPLVSGFFLAVFFALVPLLVLNYSGIRRS